MSIIDPVSGYPSDLSELELLKAENKHLRTQLETERLRLAACGTAALGYFDGCKGKYRSASLEDVLLLRTQLRTARNDALEEAAKVCIEKGNETFAYAWPYRDAADAIRAMKEKT